MTLKEVIHDTLTAAAASGTFRRTHYTSAMPPVASVGDLQSPGSVEANEVRAAFGINSDYGRELQQERQGWAWTLILRFRDEVSLEEFETDLLADPLFIQADPANGRPFSVRLLLEDAAYEHPPRGGASNGTTVTYRFVADECR